MNNIRAQNSSEKFCPKSTSGGQRDNTAQRDYNALPNRPRNINIKSVCHGERITIEVMAPSSSQMSSEAVHRKSSEDHTSRDGKRNMAMRQKRRNFNRQQSIESSQSAERMPQASTSQPQDARSSDHQNVNRSNLHCEFEPCSTQTDGSSQVRLLPSPPITNCLVNNYPSQQEQQHKSRRESTTSQFPTDTTESTRLLVNDESASKRLPSPYTYFRSRNPFKEGILNPRVEPTGDGQKYENPLEQRVEPAPIIKQPLSQNNTAVIKTFKKQVSVSSSQNDKEYQNQRARSDKELLKLKVAYQRRRIKLLKKRQKSTFSTDSVDSEDEMYSENEKKKSCQETLFGRQARKWAFWSIVAFLAALTVKDVVSLIMEYCEDQKQSDMNIMFNESMTMPNITFCMSRAQAWSHFRVNVNETPAKWDALIQDQLSNMTDRASMLSSPWDYRMVMETYNLISALTSMERETTTEGSANTIDKFAKHERFKMLRKTLRMWLDILDDRGITFEEFTQKVGKETLRRSMQRFQRTSYKEDEVIKTGMRITWISQLQLCFQPEFDSENFKTIDDQGNFFVMVLSHNAEKLNGQQVDCMSVDFHGRASSNSRFSGSKGQARDGFNDEQCMGMMHETTVEVKASYDLLPNDDEGTACRDQEDGQESEFDCHARCRMEFIASLCNCTAPTLSYLVDEATLKMRPMCDYTTCKINVQTANYSNEECTRKCYRDCNQIRYEIDHERKGKSVRPDLTTIYLNWGSFEYLTLKQDWVWTVSSFIAALGGSIGMWLGLSILSLIQGGTYMYKYLTQTVIKKKKNRVSTSSDVIKSNKSSMAGGVYPDEISHKPTGVNDDVPIAVNPFSSPFKSKSLTKPPPES